MALALRKLREQRGEIALRLGVILLVATILFVIVFNVRHAYQIVDMVIDRTNEAVLSVAAINGPAAAGGLREGEALSRNYDGYNWRRIVNTDDVRETLNMSLGTVLEGASLVRGGSYRIDDLVTTYVNSDGNVLRFRTTLRLTIFLTGGEGLAVERDLEVLTTYEAKF